METIKKYLDQTGESQNEFAKRAEISQMTVSRWYTGTPPTNLRILRQIAKAMGIEVTTLIRRIAEDTRKQETKCTP